MKLVQLLAVFGALAASAWADVYVSEVRQNFQAAVNDEIVKQVQRELTASYVYQAYASFFGRADVALPGFQKFFSEASKEERDHAQKLIDYVNLRGGHVKYDSIDLATACDAMADIGILSAPRSRPCICEFVWTKSNNECGNNFENKYGLQAMEDALALERHVNDKLLELHQTADTNNDAHASISLRTQQKARDRFLIMTTMKAILCFVSCVTIASAFEKDFVSEVRQNFDEKSNSDLNNQMAAFQRTSLVYMAYASYFDRGNINLPGFRKFFQAASQAAFKDSYTVMDYINMRGGHQQFPIIDMNAACKMMKAPKTLQGAFPDHTPKICSFVLKRDPSVSLKDKKSYFEVLFGGGKAEDQSRDEDWQTGLMALSDALLMERTLNQQLLDVASGALLRRDRHLRHTIEDSFLGQQTERIKKLADVIARLRQYTEEDYPLGEYVIDLEMSA